MCGLYGREGWGRGGGGCCVGELQTWLIESCSLCVHADIHILLDGSGGFTLLSEMGLFFISSIYLSVSLCFFLIFCLCLSLSACLSLSPNVIFTCCVCIPHHLPSPSLITPHPTPHPHCCLHLLSLPAPWFPSNSCSFTHAHKTQPQISPQAQWSRFLHLTIGDFTKTVC